MKHSLKILLLILFPVLLHAQQNLYWEEEWSKEQIDSLRSAWNQVHNDTLKMAIARSLGFYYQETDRDSSLYFSEQQLSLAQKLHQTLWQADASDQLAYVLAQMKNYPRSLQTFLDGISISEKEEAEKNIWRISIFSPAKDPKVARLTVLGYINNDVAVVFKATGNLQDALNHLFIARRVGESIKNYAQLSMTTMQLGDVYFNLNKLDSSLIYTQDGLHYADEANFQKYRGDMLLTIGDIYLKKGNNDLSKRYFQEAALSAQRQNNLVILGNALLDMARLFISSGNTDSSLWYASKGLNILETANDPEGIIDAYSTLASVYKFRNKFDSAFKYQSLAMQMKEQQDNVEKINQFKNVGFSEQERLQQLEIEKTQYKNEIRTYVLLSGLGVIIIVALLLYRNNKQKIKANHLLAKQKEEIQNTLSELRSTQAQLIQSEKMASLGELTAGIAHEIQNPLNFVNNFSEVNKEMLEELKAERLKPKAERDDDLQNDLIYDVIANEEKINHHGKRADAIVKSMLQHSKTSTGKKELTNINALADEYLRLSYHGMRAKDKSFNAEIKTDFDSNVGKVNVVPQDIGRVLLNLFNNAFYTVNEKKQRLDGTFDPVVTVFTKKENESVILKVQDNGNGIPQNIIDKIFQPFFTTKPTGQGTGLGLSLTYDIITKEHNGTITVESREGEGTEFVIHLPM
jgi:signal transduction histidine kinase